MTRATLALASSLVSERPEATCAELRGPRLRFVVSTPETVSCETSMGAIWVWAREEEPPEGD